MLPTAFRDCDLPDALFPILDIADARSGWLDSIIFSAGDAGEMGDWGDTGDWMERGVEASLSMMLPLGACILHQIGNNNLLVLLYI